MAQPRIVIVGGGFGGLAAAKALKNAPAEVILIDRANHHLFQPLLYQVATAALTPSQIATPIRSIFRKQKNVTVILGEVTGVDKERKCVFASDADRERVPVAYDYLILATGATHSYFGHNEFEEFAPGLKSLADAVSSRNKILQAFEQAEAEEDPSRHPELLDFHPGRRRPNRCGDGQRSGDSGPNHAEVRFPPDRSRFRKNCAGRHGPASFAPVLGGSLGGCEAKARGLRSRSKARAQRRSH